MTLVTKMYRIGLFSLIAVVLMGGYSFAQTCDGGTVEPGEECELGDLGCGNDCFFEQPSCTLIPNAVQVELGTPVTFASTVTNGNVSSALNFGNGYDESWATSVTYTYPTLGTYVASFSVANPGYPNLTETCTATVTVEQALCGNGIADAGEACGDAGTPGCSSGDVCHVASCSCQSICPTVGGDPINFYVSQLNFGDGRDDTVAADVSHPYQFAGDYTAGFRVVNVGNSGVQAVCQTDIDVIANNCGNGVVDAGEECGEPGYDTCTGSQICNPYSCACNNSCEQTNIVVEEECDDGMYCSDGTSCLYNSECAGIGDGLCTVRSGDGCSNVCEDEYCGDGYADLDGFDNILGNADDELCDDGNPINDDACTNRCTLPTCGDGIIDPNNETCDEGSSCYVSGVLTECTLDPTICDNGLADCIPRGTTTCSDVCNDVPRCGDGIVQSDLGEECDNGGANNDNGECNTSCEYTFCGDNIPQSPNGTSLTGVLGDGFGEQCDELYCSDGRTCSVDSDCGGGDTCIRRPGGRCSDECQLQELDPYGECGALDLYYDGDHSAFTGQISQVGDLCVTGVPTPIEQLPGGGNPDAANFVTVAFAGGSTQLYDTGSNWLWDCVGDDNGVENSITCETWECGDGILHYSSDPATIEGEQCDDGNNIDGDGCSASCELEVVLTNTFGGSCIDDTGTKDGVLPVVHENEFLPVRWELDGPGAAAGLIDWGATACAELTAGSGKYIPGGAMKCNFEFWNTDGYVGEEYGDCYNGITSRAGDANNPITLAEGSAVMDDVLDDEGYSSATDRSSILGVAFKDMSEIVDPYSPVYGQYKVLLERVDFTYCSQGIDIYDYYVGNGGVVGGPTGQTVESLESLSLDKSYPDSEVNTDQQSFDDIGAICETKVSVAQGYLTQKGAVLQEVENTQFDNFTSFSNVDFVVEGTPLSNEDINLVQIAQSNQGQDWLFNGFIEEFKDRALISKNGTEMGMDGTSTIWKVPNDTIFFYEETGTATVLDLNTTVIGDMLEEFNVGEDEPFTFVVDNPTITVNINSDLAFNGSYIVNGDISFNPEECDLPNVIEGIFITNGEFKAEELRNDDLSGTERCSGGSLAIDGILVGDGINSAFANTRRSTLSAWETDAYLFDDGLPGQAGSLFDTCYLPNLMEYTMHNTTQSLDKFARPVTLTPEGKYSDEVDPYHICSVLSFDRGKAWLEENYGVNAPTSSRCDAATPDNCPRPADLAIATIDPTSSANVLIPSLEKFEQFARGRKNFWIFEYIKGNLSIVKNRFSLDQQKRDIIREEYVLELPTDAEGGVETINTLTDCPVEEYNCVRMDIVNGGIPQGGSTDVTMPIAYIRSNQNISTPPNGYIPKFVRTEPSGVSNTPLREYGSTGEVIFVNRDLWNIARDQVMENFIELKREFVGFGEVVESYTNIFSPVGGLLGSIKNVFGPNGYIKFIPGGIEGFVGNISSIMETAGANYLSHYNEYVGFEWLNNYRNQISQQNISKSNELFDGSSVLLELNAGKWSRLSPGLKSYLDQTVVEK